MHVTTRSFAVSFAGLRLREQVERERLVRVDASAERARAEDWIDATGLDNPVDVDDTLSEADALH